MSEEIQMTEEQVVEKTAAEQVEEHMSSIVEQKTADMVTVEKMAETVEAVKSEVTESAMEGLKAMSEQLDSMKEQVMDLEAKASSPAIIRGGNNMIKFDKIDHEGTQVTGQKFSTLKAQLDNVDVPGGRVGSNMPYHTLEQMNPFRVYGSVLPSGGAGVVKLPDVAGISWASEAAQPAGARTPGGTSTSKNVLIETWVSENEYSLANLQDVPGMDGAIVSLMADQLGLSEQADGVAVVKAATGLGYETTTGVATGLPAPDAVVGKMADMIAGLGSRYSSSGSFMLSRGLYGDLQSSNNTTLNFDPRTGISTLFGRPVVIADGLEDATVDGNLVAIFGDIRRGVALCTAGDMTIGRYDQTRPGAMTYFGHARFKHSVWDGSALATMKVGA